MSTSVTRPVIDELHRERSRRLEGASGRRRLVLPFGIKAIDRHLPGGGLALGALHEVAGGGDGAPPRRFLRRDRRARGERSYGALPARICSPPLSGKPDSSQTARSMSRRAMRNQFSSVSRRVRGMAALALS
jgi:hypothetical protein